MHFNAGTVHLLALFCTLVVEGSGMALWASLAYPRPWRAIGCAIIVNLVVHTLFWYTQPIFVADWPFGLYRSEVLVVVVEGALYARLLALSGITPWLLSTLFNLASLLTGLWLWQTLL